MARIGRERARAKSATPAGFAQAPSEASACPEEDPWQLRAILDTCDDAIITTDLRGMVRIWNRAAERLFGYPAREVLGRSITLLFPKDCASEETDFLARLREGGRICNHETVRVHKEGRRIPVSLTVSPIHDAAGRITGLSKVVRDLTERKELEEALREREQRIQATFERAAVGIVELDSGDRLVAINERACQILGYPREELLGMTVHELTAPEDRHLSERLNAQLRNNEIETFTYEKRYVRRDGSRVWAHVAVSPIRDALGHHVRHIGTIEDISERKRAEEERERLVLALQEAARGAERDRAQLEAVFQAMSDGVMVFDMHGELVLVNEAEAKILGCTSAAAVKRELGEYADVYELTDEHGATVPVSDWPISRVLRGESVKDWELHTRHRETGREWVFSFAGEPVRNDEGRQILAVVITRDVTSRKRADEALRESESKYRTITDAMPHLVWGARAGGAVDYVNRKWTDYTGLSLAESEGDGWLRAIHPEDLERVTRVWKAAITAQTEFNCDYRLASREGTYRWFRSWGVPLREGDHRVVNWFGACTDIDDSVRAREELAGARDHLERIVQERTARLQEMVAELETFSYSIAHDMRGPLRTMQGFSQAVLEDYSDKLGPEGKEYLERIQAAAARQDHFIRDVLAYSRVVRQDLGLAPVDLDSLVDEVVAEYPNLQQAREQITVRHPLGAVVGHAPSLVQCLSNLLGNALKFVAPGITPSVTVWTENRGDRLRLWVQDNGLGIACDQQPRLFRLFERLHGQGEYPGTGIGLAVVRKAVERMEGAVGVESELGQGSRFWLELRRADG